MFKNLLLLFLILVPAVAFAVPMKGEKAKCSACHNLSISEANKVVKQLGGTVKSSKLSPVPGLYQITVEKDGRQMIAYIDFGKRYIIPHPIFDLTTGKAIAEPPAAGPASYKKVDVTKIPTKNSLVMGNPKGKKKLFVFTDPECPFCGKLHAELKKLVASDKSVTVYVKLLPLQMHPQAYDKARVIMARNSLDLLDKAFAHQPLPAASPLDPRQPVDETINLAMSLGINATPTMVLPDGRVVQGSRDVNVLQKLLSGKK